MSIGPPGSRSSSNSSTFMLFRSFQCHRICPCARTSASDADQATTICCGLLTRSPSTRLAAGLALGPGGGGFEGVEPAFQGGTFLAGGDGDRLDRLEFLAADHVEAADPVAHALAKGILGLAAHAGDGAGGAVHHLDEIVEQTVFGLHDASSLKGSERDIGTSVRRRKLFRLRIEEADLPGEGRGEAQ